MASLPTVPPAPVRFSTTNCWPVICVIAWQNSRDRMSFAPPGA